MSLPRIPDTWALTQLGSVTEYGRTTKAEPDKIEASAWVLELEDIEKNTSKLLARMTFTERQSKSTKNQFDTRDVLYGKLRPYLNKILIADRAGYCTTEIIPLKSGNSLDNRYLFYWLKHPKFLSHVEAASHGMNMPRLGTDAGRNAPFVLAPLNEQKRIADKLDAVLARVDACRNHLDHIPTILKRFRQSVLATATSGKLTEEWRGISELAGWTTFSLSDVCLSITDGDHQAPPQAEAGIPFITISAINDGRLRLEKASRFVPLSYFEALKDSRRPQRGDILFSVTGSIGIPAMVDTDSAFTFQRHIAILRPDYSKVSSSYLKYVLGAERLQQQALAVATGTAQLTIPLTGLRSFQIDVPSTEEQTEIVRRVESLFAYADRLEARYAAARAQVENLTPATLAKAFRGELVPQDPNDEPASVLLARIRAARTDTPKPQRGRRNQNEFEELPMVAEPQAAYPRRKVRG